MRMRAQYGWFAVVLVIALALPAGSAAARERLKSTVTIKTGETAAGQEFLNGKVKSKRAKCERNRNVVLFWNAPGPPGGFTNVADDASDEDGRWRILPPGTEVPPGQYYVKVTRIERRGDICKGARSRTITVPVS